MEIAPKHTPLEKDDIAQQPYRGPSVASAAAGEGYIAHFQWAGLGLLIGGGLAALIPNSINKIAAGFSTFHHNHRTSSNGFMRLGALSVGAIRHGVDFITGHIPGKTWLSTKMAGHRYEAVIFGGSLASAFGFFVVPWLLAGKGISKGLEGRRQFERAKDEIWDLRAENDQLRERTVELKTQLNDLETSRAAEEKRLRVRQDEPPVIRTEASGPGQPEGVNLETPTSIEPPPIREPEIKEPKIGPANQDAIPHSAKVERPKADREWAEAVQDAAPAERARH